MKYWRGAGTVEAPSYFETTTNKPGRTRRMSLTEEFFAVLVRLKLGLLLDDISQRFQMSPSHFSHMFTIWISLLYLELKLLNPWPSQEQVARHTPQQLMKYRNTRVIIGHQRSRGGAATSDGPLIAMGSDGTAIQNT